jgi:hypothetical protein
MTRQTLFGRGHQLEYSLKIIERKSDGNEVIAVQCQFCVFIGREIREGPGVKRKRTNNVHMFRLPFRQELYRKHLESVHAQDWIAYKAPCPEQKRAFFDEKQRSGIHAYLESTKEFIAFDIPKLAIVDELIDNLFFKPELDEDDEETEPISKANALKLFRPIFDRDEDDMEDGAANDEADRFVPPVRRHDYEPSCSISRQLSRYYHGTCEKCSFVACWTRTVFLIFMFWSGALVCLILQNHWWLNQIAISPKSLFFDVFSALCFRQ